MSITKEGFTGRVRGANDRIAIGFIGLGTMGSGNLGYAMKVAEAQPVAGEGFEPSTFGL